MESDHIKSPVAKGFLGLGLGGMGLAAGVVEYRHALSVIHEVYEPCACATGWHFLSFTWGLPDTTLFALVAYVLALIGLAVAGVVLTAKGLVSFGRRLKQL